MPALGISARALELGAARGPRDMTALWLLAPPKRSSAHIRIGLYVLINCTFLSGMSTIATTTKSPSPKLWERDFPRVCLWICSAPNCQSPSMPLPGQLDVAPHLTHPHSAGPKNTCTRMGTSMRAQRQLPDRYQGPDPHEVQKLEMMSKSLDNP